MSSRTAAVQKEGTALNYVVTPFLSGLRISCVSSIDERSSERAPQLARQLLTQISLALLSRSESRADPHATLSTKNSSASNLQVVAETMRRYRRLQLGSRWYGKRIAGPRECMQLTRLAQQALHDCVLFLAASFTASMISGYVAQRQRLPER